jgi:hypothetical protein
MKKEDALSRIPREGFLKITPSGRKPLNPEQKTALIRKGNEFFNKGDIATAKRIFITTGYSDGLERVGDYHQQKGDILEALRMYWIAPAPGKKQQLIEQCAALVQYWINEKG